MERTGLSNEEELALGRAHINFEHLDKHLASQVEQLNTAASLNY